jgi:very-short-patch-repair endonuclease
LVTRDEAGEVVPSGVYLCGYETDGGCMARKLVSPPAEKGDDRGLRGKTMNITETTRHFRKNQTEAEKLFWQHVRNNQLGRKIVRQKPIIFDYDNRKRVFYADFYCAERKLIVEIDGEIHRQRKNRDFERSAILEQMGFQVIRFQNQTVIDHMDKVIAELKTLIN